MHNRPFSVADKLAAEEKSRLLMDPYADAKRAGKGSGASRGQVRTLPRPTGAPTGAPSSTTASVTGGTASSVSSSRLGSRAGAAAGSSVSSSRLGSRAGPPKLRPMGTIYTSDVDWWREQLLKQTQQQSDSTPLLRPVTSVPFHEGTCYPADAAPMVPQRSAASWNARRSPTGVPVKHAHQSSLSGRGSRSVPALPKARRPPPVRPPRWWHEPPRSRSPSDPSDTHLTRKYMDAAMRDAHILYTPALHQVP